MFRFTIRDLLWLMVVVACLLGWWNEHRRFAAYYERTNIKFNFKWTKAGTGVGSVNYDVVPTTSGSDEGPTTRVSEPR